MLQVNEKCLARIRNMGDLLGRDRVSVNTVAFGPAAEDFAVLQAMSKVLPRGSFQVRAHASFGQGGVHWMRKWRIRIKGPCVAGCHS